MIQNTQLKIIVTFFIILFFNSCNQMVYNEIDFGGNAANTGVSTLSKQHTMKENSVDLNQRLYKFDTVDYKSEFTSLKTKKPLKLKDRLMLKLALKNLPKAKFVDDYGNWLKKSFPQKNGKKIIPNQINKNSKITTVYKANYNEDVVNTGLYTAGICAGLLLISWLIGEAFIGSQAVNGCIVVLGFLFLVAGVFIGLLIALIGAIS